MARTHTRDAIPERKTAEMRLPLEILLEIFEHLDAASMMNFGATSKAMAMLTGRYEASISRRCAHRFLLPPAAAILSSNQTRRSVIPAGSFAMVRELELRDARIDYVLLRSGFADLAAPPGLRPLTCVEQLQHLFPLLKRALCHCDQIADIAANPTVRSDVAGKDLSGIRAGGDDTVTTEVDLQGRPRTAFARYDARPQQVAYIQSLDLEQTSCLLYMLILLSIGFVEGAGGCEPIGRGNPIEWEQVTIFEEGILRHGSWFLWAHIMASRTGRLRRLKHDMMAEGLQELIAWETGKDRVLPGLKMTVLERFRNLVREEKDMAGEAGEDDWGGHDDNVGHMFCIVRQLVHKKQPARASEGM